MELREQNRQTVRRLITTPYWLSENADIFAEDFALEFPSAPPGMPQYMDRYMVDEYFEWMRRTVQNFDAEVEDLLGTEGDPSLFWATGYWRADVNWGGGLNPFRSKFILKIRLRNGKVTHLRMMQDPQEFLRAAGREIPPFHMDIFHQEVTDLLAERGGSWAKEASSEPLDVSPLAIRRRIQNNLDAFRRGDYWGSVAKLCTFSADCESLVWFLPREMGHCFPLEEMPRVEAWSELSCPEIDFDCNGVSYQTEDPHVYFCEYRCHGVTKWLGNGVTGRYRNDYFYILRFNDAGEICRSEEFLNPVNKFNSINVSLPSFPYYL